MTTYTPTSIDINTSLDIIGSRVGLQRLPEETPSAFKRRIRLQSTSPPGASQVESVKFADRYLGLQSKLMMAIFTTAVDPRIIFEHQTIYVYSDWSSGTADLTIDIRPSENVTIQSIYDQINGLAGFSVTSLWDTSTDDNYLSALNLRFEDSQKYVRQQFLQPSKVNELKPFLQNVYINSPQLVTEVNQAKLLAGLDEDEYHIDYTNGLIFSFEQPTGTISYTYNLFPMFVSYEAVRLAPLNSETNTAIFQDQVADQNVTAYPSRFSAKGIEIYNSIYGAHPLNWGS